MAVRTGEPQALADQAVPTKYSRGIAEAVYRADRQDENLRLSDQPFDLQADYDRVGLFVMRLSDESQLRAGLYAGADALVAGGIGRLDLKQRAAAVGTFTRAFMAMKRQMNGTAPRDEMELMFALAAEDRRAGIQAMPVITKASVDVLASIDASALGVH